MELRINHKIKSFEEDLLSVQMLLDSICPEDQQGIAIAIGTQIVSRANWSSTLLSDQDEVLLITATQGG